MSALPGLSILKMARASHTTLFRLATILKAIWAGIVDRLLVQKIISNNLME